MIGKISAYVKKHHMLSDGDTVVAGVSGGADSVCLLFVLKELQKQYDFSLHVVHVNHLIREEAAEDAVYVEKLCGQLDVPFTLVEKDVESLAAMWKMSTEEAGRKVRYEAFEKVLDEQAKEAFSEGKAKIAVAHNCDDRAETMLFHLFRGTGISGLCSIRPKRDKIIRPLLCVTREEIEVYLAERGIAFCIDKTNSEDTYTRNKIRHHILPYAKAEVAEGILSHMSTTADLMLETEDFIHQETEKAYGRCVTGQGVNVQEFLACHSLIRKQLILKVIENLVSTKRDISSFHVKEIESLFEQPGNRQVDLPYGICVRREYERVFFEVVERGAGQNLTGPERTGRIQEWDVSTEGELSIHIPGLGELEFSTFSYEKGMNIPQNQYTKWFDYDKIDKSLKIRNRKTGDYLTINKELSKKSLQDYMVDEKIPKNQRDNLWVLADENHILWVIGYRISEKYKICGNTKKILQVQLRGGH